MNMDKKDIRTNFFALYSAGLCMHPVQLTGGGFSGVCCALYTRAVCRWWWNMWIMSHLPWGAECPQNARAVKDKIP